MKKSIKYLCFSLLTMTTLSACTNTNTQYYWGEYESLIYKMYISPGEATPEEQISTLTQDIEKAKNNDKLVPPGIYAHLGFMYSLTGDLPSAIEAFNKEKQLFPESKILIDRLAKRANEISNKK